MSRRVDIQLLQETNRVSSDVTHEIMVLVDGGADPNALQRDPGNYRSPLGNVVWRGYARATRALLSVGACVHWPDREIQQINLTGANDKAYDGLPLDALQINLNQLGWILGEHMPLGLPAADVALDEHLAILGLLLHAGANPAWEDPATCMMPAEAFLRGFIDSTFDWSCPVSLTSPVLLDTIAGVVVQMIDALEPTQTRSIIENIASQQWDRLPYGWSLFSQCPSATPALVARMTDRILEKDTGPTLASRPSARL